MNTPYVKKYVNGILQNPIIGAYLHTDGNRHDRRTTYKGQRISPRLQHIKLKNGKVKTIKHYL